MRIRALVEADREWLRELIEERWGLPVVSTSGLHDPATLAGLVAEDPDGRRVGVLTYCLGKGDMEVVTLDSLDENRGVGIALFDRAKALVTEADVRL